MYFEDLTPYTYTNVRTPGDASLLVNFGWLDDEHEYPRGPVEAELVERLLRLASRYTNSMRGYHRCPFCKDRKHISMRVDDEDVYLGSAEVRVTFGDATYIAPSLVPHYIAVHRYKPPEAVLQAIEAVAVHK